MSICLILLVVQALSRSQVGERESVRMIARKAIPVTAEALDELAGREQSFCGWCVPSRYHGLTTAKPAPFARCC